MLDEAANYGAEEIMPSHKNQTWYAGDQSKKYERDHHSLEDKTFLILQT